MSTVLHPVGPRSERVYWVRRFLVLAVVLVLAAVGWAIVRPAGDGGGAGDVGAEVGAGTGTQDQAGAEGEADVDAKGGPATCTAASLTLTLTSSARGYPAGSQPVFTVAITNSGDSACTVDAGETGREVLITSGADRIWSSLDCPTGGGERLLLLEPGARDETQVSWARVRSAEGCPAGLAEPRPGTYSALVTVLGASTAAAVLELS